MYQKNVNAQQSIFNEWFVNLIKFVLMESRKSMENRIL